MEEKEKTEGIVRLWNQTFGDSEVYIRRMLERIPVSLRKVAYCNGEVAAMFLGAPHQCRIFGREVPVIYGLAASAAPSVRGTGIWATTAQDLIKASGESDAVLFFGLAAHAKLVPYYRTHSQSIPLTGWRSVDWKSSRTLIEEYQIVQYTDNSQYLLDDIYKDIPHIVLPGKEVFTVAKEFLTFYVAINTSGVVEAIVGVDLEQLPELYMLGATNDRAREALLEYVATKYHRTQLTYRGYDPTCDLPNIGLGRIVNVKRFLDLYAETHPDVEVNYQVFDPIIETNNQNFSIKKGLCTEWKPEDGLTTVSISVDCLAERTFPHIFMPLSFY